MEILTKLGIDTTILVGQMINFAILTYILYRLLYRPVLQILDERQKKIKEGLDNAEAAKSAMMSAKVEKEKILSEARTEAEMILANAELVAISKAEEAVKILEEKLINLKKQAKSEISAEQIRMVSEIEGRIVEIAIAMNKKIFADDFSEEQYKKTLVGGIEKLNNIE